MVNTVETAGTSDEREVLRLLETARRSGEADAFVGKRHWMRHSFDLALDVSMGIDNGEICSASLHNISGGGFGFWSKRQLEAGTRIRVREASETSPGAWMAARVKHCTVGMRGYLVGAEFDHPLAPDHAPKEGAAEPSRTPSSRAGRSTVPASLRSLRSKAVFACATVTVFTAFIAYGAGALTAVHELGWPASPSVVLTVALGLGGFSGAWMVRHEVRALRLLQVAVRGLAQGDATEAEALETPSKDVHALHSALMDLTRRWRQREQAERLQRQRLEEVTRIKSNILAIVSHDLRTPLTSILLYTQMLTEELDTLPDEDKLHFLQIVSDECTRLTRLLDDLLEVQQLESGHADWKLRTQDLSSTIQSCLGVFEALAKSRSITLTLHCPPSLPPVKADVDRMSQVLSNLLSNALKFTPDGGRVAVSAEPRGGEIVFCVADTGQGIPRDKWDHIFDRFSQLSDPNVSTIHGFGLGLNIVKKIVEAHGGSVWCDSEVGKGSEFYVSLPIRAATPAGPSELDAARSAKRVLVCDADPELAATIAQTLRRDGFDVHVVHSGCRLLALLDQGSVDVVITDVLLPDMDASDLLDSLSRVRDRSFKLIVHSYAGEGCELIRKRGADIFLRRPVSKEELILAVHTAMRKGAASGLSVVVVNSEAIGVKRIAALLGDAGHMPMLAETLHQAVALTQGYATDLVLIPSDGLSDDWEELAASELLSQDPARVIVVCRHVRRKERQLARALGVGLAEFQPGQDEEFLAALTVPQPALVEEHSV